MPAIAAAQQTPSQPATPAPAATPTASVPVEFSGLFFPQFIYGGPKGNGTRSANQFQLERAYLTAKAKIGDRTTLRFTSDIYRPGGNNGYTMRAKYAYLQYDYWTNGEGFIGSNAQLRLGMQQTILNETEEAFWPRYVAKIAVERKCGRFEWSVLDWNTRAIDFYRSLGAVAMDEWTVQRMTGAALQRLGSSMNFERVT